MSFLLHRVGFSPQVPVHQRRLEGNLLQAFVRAAMLECSVTLSQDVRLVFGG